MIRAWCLKWGSQNCDADDVAPGDVVMVRCDVVMANCTGTNKVYETRPKCLGVCKLLDIGEAFDYRLPELFADSATIGQWAPFQAFKVSRLVCCGSSIGSSDVRRTSCATGRPTTSRAP